MPRVDNESHITPSVLDRLQDNDPQRLGEAPIVRSDQLRDLKQAVKRDLEWLLNTRQVVNGAPAGLSELTRSLAAYGLPDFTALSVRSLADQQRIQRAIETAISIFEPRLEGVQVILAPVSNMEQKLRFRIEARLRIEPAPVPVTFDTVLQASSNQYVIKAE